MSTPLLLANKVVGKEVLVQLGVASVQSQSLLGGKRLLASGRAL